MLRPKRISVPPMLSNIYTFEVSYDQLKVPRGSPDGVAQFDLLMFKIYETNVLHTNGGEW